MHVDQNYLKTTNVTYVLFIKNSKTVKTRTRGRIDQRWAVRRWVPALPHMVAAGDSVEAAERLQVTALHTTA